MGKLIGYARISTNEQNLDMQLDALLKAGCSRKDIFSDKISGAKSEREGLNKCLESLEHGDTLIVRRLDRLGRSMSHLVGLIEQLLEKGVKFKSLCDGAIDTTTASGELIFNIFSSLAQFERRLIQERTRAGLEAARSRGKIGGRPSLPSNHPKIIAAKEMYNNKNLSISQICETLKISKATFYRYLTT